MNRKAATVVSRSPLVWSAITLVALLVLAWFAYRPAMSATFLLDDAVNLGGLAGIEDTESALDFVLSGKAGPLGRPIAFASFVPQASAWGSDPSVFLRTNVLIHLVNAALLYVLAWQVALTMRLRKQEAFFAAAATTALWLFMPLLASASLLIVQRMTTLSALFVLAGVNLYLVARSRIEQRPRTALIGMSIALALGTLLAGFSKENGILLPVLILCLESTLLAPPERINRAAWRTWHSLCLVTPTLVILLYLISLVPYSDEVVTRRDFTAWQRLLTESQILWDYLASAFVARPGQFGPFHDAYPVASSPPGVLALASALSWIVLVPVALISRRTLPLAAFAILWFIGGHLLESTTVPLELYFEHRNYVPIMGPVLAFSLYAALVRAPYLLYARAAILLLAALNAGVLLSITSLWGKPLQAAAYWAQQSPASVRSATTLAQRQLHAAGPAVAISSLRQFAFANPEHAYIRIPELNLACSINPEADSSALVDYLDTHLPSVSFTYTAGSMLDELLTTAVTVPCKSVDPSTVADLALALASNPRYRASGRYTQFHHALIARIARISGDTEETLQQLAQAIEFGPSVDIDMMMVTTLVEAKRYDEARSFIEEAYDRLPLHPLRRLRGKRNLEQLANYVSEMERIAAGGRGTRPGTDGEND